MTDETQGGAAFDEHEDEVPFVDSDDDCRALGILLSRVRNLPGTPEWKQAVLALSDGRIEVTFHEFSAAGLRSFADILTRYADRMDGVDRPVLTAREVERFITDPDERRRFRRWMDGGVKEEVA